MEHKEPSADHLKVLRTYFKHGNFKNIQWSIIRAILYDKRDCCVIASTGFGKSLIYQFPPVFANKLVVVICPLIALMQDQVASLKAKGIRACFFGSAQPDKSLLMKDHNLCYMTPEYLANQAHRIIAKIRDQILFFAIDEAHLVEQWRDFRKEYKQLGSLREKYPEIPIIALTATAPQYVQDYITKALNLHENFYLVKTALDRPNLSFEVKASTGDYVSQVLPLLKQVETGSAIVYCIPQAGTEIMSEKFRELGLDCRPYHAKLPNEVKTATVEDFRTGKLRFVVCTIAFGMGIDKPDVRLVVHYGLCKSIEAYYQEAGRAGRDGNPSKCIVFLDHSDKAILYKFIRDSKEVTADEKQQQYRLVDKFIEFLISDKCRRLQMLDYLGTTPEEKIKMTIRDSCCDNCKSDLTMKVPAKLMYHDINEDGTSDFTEDARILLKAAYPAMQHRTAVIDNILGELPNDKNFRHFKLQTLGSGTARTRDYWESLISMLVLNKYCSVAGNCLTLERTAKHLIKFNGRKLMLAPSHAIRPYLTAKKDVEFFWDNNEIKVRPKDSMKLLGCSKGSTLMGNLSEEEKRLQEKRELDCLAYLEWDSDENDGCDELPKKIRKLDS